MSITNFLEKVPAKLQEVYDEKLSAYITEEYNVHMLYLEEIYPVIFQQIQERAMYVTKLILYEMNFFSEKP